MGYIKHKTLAIRKKMRKNFHAKCPFNNESETILLQLCIEFFASLKENFIYLDLQMLWLSSLETGTEI